MLPPFLSVSPPVFPVSYIIYRYQIKLPRYSAHIVIWVRSSRGRVLLSIRASKRPWTLVWTNIVCRHSTEVMAMPSKAQYISMSVASDLRSAFTIFSILPTLLSRGCMSSANRKSQLIDSASCEPNPFHFIPTSYSYVFQ